MPQRVLLAFSLLAATGLTQNQSCISTSGSGCNPRTQSHNPPATECASRRPRSITPSDAQAIAPNEGAIISVVTSGGVSSKPLAFSDTFSGGKLDSTKWFIDTGKAPGNIAGINHGTLSAEHVDLSTGMLRLTLTQSITGGLATSVGAEIRSKRLLGYGTYVWVARAASTSPTPNGVGSTVSGTVTDLFNFVNNSQTEIDFEYEGQFPSILEMTNYATVSRSQSTSTTVSGADKTFHEYKFMWSPTKIKFYVDGAVVSAHTQNIPSTPAAALINIWGTNSSSFGGIATDGISRYLYVSSFSYTRFEPVEHQ
jgi:beta-glucanase (GH16 family)